MKVTFSTKFSNVEIVKAEVATFNEVLDDNPTARRQELVFNEQNQTLVFEGARTSLVDGCGDALNRILKVFGSKQAADKALLSVETSEPNVHWALTMAQAVEQLTVQDLINRLAAKECRLRSWSLQAAFGRVVRHFGVKNLEALSKNPKWVAAQFDAETVAQMRLVLKAFNANPEIEGFLLSFENSIKEEPSPLAYVAKHWF